MWAGRRRKTSLTAIVILILSMIFLGTDISENASATTLYVGGAGPDNYTTIQAAIDDADPGYAIYVHNGTYFENILVAKPLSLIGEDVHGTIVDGDRNGTVVNISAHWVNMTGFTVTNSKTVGEYAGIKLYHARNCRITDNNASSNWVGILLLDSQYNVISGNTVGDNEWGLELTHSSGNTIIDNTAKGNWQPISLSLSGFNTIAWNDAIANWDGIRLHSSPSNTIANNNASMNNSTGILLFDSHGNTIINNTISRNGFEGIFLNLSNYGSIADNTLQDHEYGITLRDSTNITIENNTLSVDDSIANGDYGIHLFHSNNIVMEGNNISGTGKAIYLQESDFLSVAQNNLFNNKGEGIRSWYGHNITVDQNNILNNGLGIRLFFSEGYMIYHNSFIGNLLQAADDGNLNRWDDGYPSGGNHWSDYGGVDHKSGPGQNQPGSDGIGDTPYVIDLDSMDRYPLMAPYAVPLHPPEMLDATLNGTDYEDIMITWSLSPDDGSGLDSVIAYDIFRGTTYDSEGSGYGLVGSSPKGTPSFVDGSAGEGDANDYFYRVCAVDLSGNSSCSLIQAGKFTRPLPGGPNLVSVPLIQSDESIETVLQTVKYDKAWYYDSYEEWKWHMAFKSYRRGLWNVNHSIGLWINVTGPSNLTVAGIVPAMTEIRLFNGWNLVSFPSFNTSYTVADLKMETGATRVEGMETMPPFPPSCLRVLGDGDMLQTGYGYWVRMDVDFIWTVYP